MDLQEVTIDYTPFTVSVICCVKFYLKVGESTLHALIKWQWCIDTGSNMVRFHHCTERNSTALHLCNKKGFFLCVCCVAPHYRSVQLIQSLLLCARNIKAFPLRAAQAGAIDVISFLEAQAKDPVAILCLCSAEERECAECLQACHKSERRRRNTAPKTG